MQFCVLASGSKGNSVLIKDNSTLIMIDNGLTLKLTQECFHKLNHDLDEVQALLISHEHNDHVQGVRLMLNAASVTIPWYIAPESYNKLHQNFRPQTVPNVMLPGKQLNFGSLWVYPFKVSHDAACTYGFIVQSSLGRTLACVTDLGKSNDFILNNFASCNVIIIEANHDEKMLINGSYPWHLKQRILSDKGHLSNRVARNIIHQIDNPKIHDYIFAHLSEENNHPDKVIETIQPELNGKTITIATQHCMTEWFEV